MWAVSAALSPALCLGLAVTVSSAKLAENLVTLPSKGVTLFFKLFSGFIEV